MTAVCSRSPGRCRPGKELVPPTGPGPVPHTGGPGSSVVGHGREGCFRGVARPRRDLAAGAPALAGCPVGGKDHGGHPGRAFVRVVRRGLGHRLSDRRPVRPGLDRRSAPARWSSARSASAPGWSQGRTWGTEPVLRIGDRCVIGRGSHIIAHYSIVIGDDVYTGPYVYITDQNHGYDDPERRSGGNGRATRRCRSAPGAGSARGRSCFRARASGGTWWSRPGPWSVAGCPTGAWSPGCQLGWCASTWRVTGGRDPCRCPAIMADRQEIGHQSVTMG